MACCNSFTSPDYFVIKPQSPGEKFNPFINFSATRPDCYRDIPACLPGP